MSQPSLGEFLRHEREQRGVTIEQVASATKISVRMLHSLESDQYAELPAMPFIRGFVTSYCRFIGLDPKDVLTRYGRFVEEKSTERPNRDAGHSGYAFEKRDADRNKTILWVVMVSCVVLSAVFILVLKPALKHKKISHVEKLKAANTEKVAVTEPKAAADEAAKDAEEEPGEPSGSESSDEVKTVAADSEEATAATEEAESEPEPSPTPSDPLNKGDSLKPEQIKHKIVFHALEDIWVRYKVDERPLMKFMLLKDKYLVLKAEDVIRFQVSNPKSTTYKYRTWKYKPLHQWDEVRQFEETATLVLPVGKLDKIGRPFAEQAALPATPDPSPSPRPTSTQRAEGDSGASNARDAS